MRRRRSGLRVIHLFWVVCLCAPPAVRLGLDHSRQPGQSATERLVAQPTLEPGFAVAEAAHRLRQAERDLEALGVTLVSEEYERVLARVLSTHDPAADRGAMYVGVRSRKPIPADITAITTDYLLAGRVVDVVEPPFGAEERFAIARIQTVLDRYFRVRFVTGDPAGDVRGLAGGTGTLTEDGHPLLEIIFLDGSRAPEEGEAILTAPMDQVYAPGIRIGTVTLDAGSPNLKRRNRLPLIRSEVALLRQDQVILLADLMKLSAARASPGWRP